MDREKATAIIFELLTHAVQRGVFSSVEIEALKRAEEAIRLPPVAEVKEEAQP